MIIVNLETDAAPDNKQPAAAGQRTATQEAIMQQQEELGLGSALKLLNVSISWYLKAENVTIVELERKHGGQSGQINKCFLC